MVIPEVDGSELDKENVNRSNVGDAQDVGRKRAGEGRPARRGKKKQRKPP